MTKNDARTLDLAHEMFSLVGRDRAIELAKGNADLIDAIYAMAGFEARRAARKAAA